MPATPQDHKSKAEASTEPFTFEHDGETYTLPGLKFGHFRRHRHLPEDEMFWVILEELAAEEVLAALDDMDLKEVNSVIDGWQQHLGLSAGNS